MTNPNNLTATDASIPEGNTLKFFNNYFLPAFTVSQNIDDAILSYFEKVTGNRESARILASSVVYTCLVRNLDPMETLDKFLKTPISDLNSYLIMFLNLNRVGTSFLGINNANMFKEQYFHE
jgi:hypothetical protein